MTPIKKMTPLGGFRAVSFEVAAEWWPESAAEWFTREVRRSTSTGRVVSVTLDVWRLRLVMSRLSC